MADLTDLPPAESILAKLRGADPDQWQTYWDHYSVTNINGSDTGHYLVVDSNIEISDAEAEWLAAQPWAGPLS